MKKIGLGIVLVLALLLPTAAHASSGNYGAGAEYQVVVSTGQGGSNGGGFWGWFALYPNGTFDGEFTDCGHGYGAQHFHTSGNYYVAQDGNFFTYNEVDIPANGGPAMYPPASDTGIPATYGHYNLQRLFGFPPGTEFQVNVSP